MPSPDTHQLGFRVPKAYTKSLHSGLDTSQAIIIDVKSTSGSSDQRVKLEEPRVVGSYNWLRRREATIAVPGKLSLPEKMDHFIQILVGL